MNPVTYPNFLRFLKLKKIPLLETEMSFSLSRDGGQFEWAGSSLRAVFSQMSNLWNAGMYRTIFDILRFNAFAIDLLDMEETDELRALSISTYLDEHNYSQVFRDNYLIASAPLGARLTIAHDCSDMVYGAECLFVELSCADVDSIHAQSSFTSNIGPAKLADHQERSEAVYRLCH